MMDTADITFTGSMLVDVLGGGHLEEKETDRGRGFIEEEEEEEAVITASMNASAHRFSLTAPLPQSLPPPPHSPPQAQTKTPRQRQNTPKALTKEASIKEDAPVAMPIVPKNSNSSATPQKIKYEKSPVPPLKMCFQGIELELPHAEGTRLDIKPDGSLRLRLHNFSGDVTLTKILPGALSASMRIDQSLTHQREWPRQSLTSRIQTIPEQSLPIQEKKLKSQEYYKPSSNTNIPHNRSALQKQDKTQSPDIRSHTSTIQKIKPPSPDVGSRTTTTAQHYKLSSSDDRSQRNTIQQATFNTPPSSGNRSHSSALQKDEGSTPHSLTNRSHELASRQKQDKARSDDRPYTAASHKWSPLRTPSEAAGLPQSPTLDTVRSVDEFAFFGQFTSKQSQKLQEDEEQHEHQRISTDQEEPSNKRATHHPSTISSQNSTPSKQESGKQSDDRPLPPGWEKRYDAQKKKFYYIDHTNRTTTWQHPGQNSKLLASARRSPMNAFSSPSQFLRQT